MREHDHENDGEGVFRSGGPLRPRPSSGRRPWSCFGAASADPPAATADPADAVKELQTKYRDGAGRRRRPGINQEILSRLVSKGRRLRQAGDDALTAGRLVEAADAFRKARWHLPAPPADLPGTRRPLLRRRPAAPQPTWSRPWPSAPTANASPPPARTAPSSSGTWRPATSCAATPATPTRCTPSPSAPTASTSPPAARTRALKIWDADTGKDVKSLTGHTDFLWCIAFSPDGKYLAAGGNDKHVRVYDLSNDSVKFDLSRPQPEDQRRRLEPRRQADRHRRRRTGPAHLEGGGRLRLQHLGSPTTTRATHRRRRLRGRQPDRGDLRQRPQLGPAHQPRRRRRTAVVRGAHGQGELPGVQQATARCWRRPATTTPSASGTWPAARASARSRATPTRSPAWRSAPTAGWRRAASTRPVRLWDQGLVEASRDIGAHDGAVWSAVFSPDGSQVVSAGADKMVRVWDVASRQAGARRWRATRPR